jgi:hypothetical protein
MQEIIARNNIPASVPFDQIASSAGYSTGSSPTNVQRLSINDQREFDHYYAEWLEHTRRNDQDDVAKDAHMQEIMARNNRSFERSFRSHCVPDAATDTNNHNKKGRCRFDATPKTFKGKRLRRRLALSY